MPVAFPPPPSMRYLSRTVVVAGPAVAGSVLVGREGAAVDLRTRQYGVAGRQRIADAVDDHRFRAARTPWLMLLPQPASKNVSPRTCDLISGRSSRRCHHRSESVVI